MVLPISDIESDVASPPPNDHFGLLQDPVTERRPVDVGAGQDARDPPFPWHEQRSRFIADGDHQLQIDVLVLAWFEHQHINARELAFDSINQELREADSWRACFILPDITVLAVEEVVNPDESTHGRLGAFETPVIRRALEARTCSADIIGDHSDFALQPTDTVGEIGEGLSGGTRGHR